MQKTSFSKAKQVVDRFHVQKLVLAAVQQILIKYRWQAIDNENKAIINAKSSNSVYVLEQLENGDTRKQLLARSRYLLYKSPEKWTENQQKRAVVLFKEYPDIKQAYDLSTQLRVIFTMRTEKGIALAKLAQWYDKAEKSGFKNFTTVKNTMSINYNEILNYFENRNTNASA